MRLTSVDARATRQAPNHNPSDDFALVSCSATLDGWIALSVRRQFCNAALDVGEVGIVLGRSQAEKSPSNGLVLDEV